MKSLINFTSQFKILKFKKTSLIVSAFLTSTTLSFAAPTAGTVTSGTANISQNANVTNINQSSSKASINWQNFSIASNETVNFNQPDVNSITLNRVIGNETSVINGALNANGQVWLLNSNGVLFGKNAKINTAGILATTSELSDSDFNSNNYNFKNSTSNSIINEGTIEVSNNGSVILASNEVQNKGTIKAVKGKVHLVGADSYSLNLNGNSLVNLTVDKGVLDSLVKNSGTIISDGGEIYLTTNAVDELLKGVVNNTGIIEANSIDDLFGKVEVFAHGGTANVSGTIEAKDGFVETSADTVKIDEDFKVTADTWLIDPKDFTIASSGGDITGTALSNNLATANVEILSVNGTTDGNGDIFVNDTISWSSDKKLTLNAENDIFINESIIVTNATGKLELLYGQGSGASNNTSNYYVNTPVNLKAGQNFTTKLGSDGTTVDWTVINSLGVAGDTSSLSGNEMTLQGINTALSGNFVLGSNIDASNTSSWNDGAGFDPIGDYDQNLTLAFKGNFDGLGHTISGLFINKDTDYSALFACTDLNTSISNVGLTDINMTLASKGAALIGYSNSKVSNSFSTGNINIKDFQTTSIEDTYGGLVSLSTESIINSYSNVNISGYGKYIGGLVGDNYGTISFSYSSGNISGTYSGPSDSSYAIGGLVAKNKGIVENSYSTSSVTGKNHVGGLVGNNIGIIKNSYSIGRVSGTFNSGGLVGSDVDIFNNPDVGTTTSSYWNKSTSGRNSSAGGIGKSSLEMEEQSTYNVTGLSWDLITDYSLSPTYKYPVLIRENGVTSWKIFIPTPVKYTLSNNTMEYNGSNYLLNDLWSSGTIFEGMDYDDWSLGSEYNFTYLGSTVTDFKNAETYSNISLNILKDGFVTSPTGNTNGSLIITPKEVTISGNKTYDGTRNLIGSDITITTGIESETLTYIDATTNNSHVATSNKYIDAITLVNAIDGSGGLSNNYKLPELSYNATKNSVTITPAIITPTISNIGYTQIYDSDISADINLSYTFTGLVDSNESVVLTNTSKLYNDKDVLDANLITVNGLEISSITGGTKGSVISDYTLDSTNKTVNATITKAPLIVTADDLTKVYGQDDVTLTYTANGLVGSDTLTGSLKRDAGENVADYAILEDSILENSNYDITFTNGKYTITPKDITITANAITKIYGNLDPSLTYTSNVDLVSGDTFVGSLNRAGGEDVNTYSISKNTLAIDDGNGGNNYSVSYIGDNLTINKRDITLSADLTTQIYGDNDSNLSVSIDSGSLGSETVNDTLLNITGILSRESGTNVGNYDLNLGTGSKANNYNITFVNDNNAFSITPKEVIISGNKTYDGTRNLIGSDITITTGVGSETLTYRDATTNNSHVVTSNKYIDAITLVNATDGSGGLANNYKLPELTYNAIKNSVTITPAIITPTISNIEYTQIYDSDRTADINPSYTFTGLVDSDESVVLTNTSKLYNDKDVLDANLITVNGLEISSIIGGTKGSVISDYTLDSTSKTVNATITKARLTVSADDLTKVYGQDDATLTYTANGLVGSDTLTGSLKREAGENVADYAILEDSILENSNYDITFTNGKYTITPKEINYNFGTEIEAGTSNGSEYLLNELFSKSTLFGDNSSLISNDDYEFIYNGNSVRGFTDANTYYPISLRLLNNNFLLGDRNYYGTVIIKDKFTFDFNKIIPRIINSNKIKFNTTNYNEQIKRINTILESLKTKFEISENEEEKKRVKEILESLY